MLSFWSRLGLAISVLMPAALMAHSYGPPPRVTAAPGDNPRACTQCHSRAVLNEGPGSVQIVLQADAIYIPGVKQRVTVRLQDPDQMRWGFEMSARLNSDPENSQAGDFTPIDNMTQVICEDAAPKPCAGGPAFITHTSYGTRAGTSGGAEFKFDWTPPSQDAGPITLYVAANAANFDSNSTGDHIYASSLELKPVNPLAPTVDPASLASLANLAPGNLAPNSWVTISGKNLGLTTRSWTGDDFLDGALPFSIDGVSVLLTAFGTPRLAYVGYVSPTKVNFLLPTDIVQAPTTVQIRNGAGISAPVPITIQTTAPQLFTFDGKSAMAMHLDGSYIDKSSPAGAGETIKVYGTGLGQTTPAMITGQVPQEGAPLATLPQITVGGAGAKVGTVTVSASSPGMYEITMQVPADAASGDLPMVIQIGSTGSPAVVLTVRK